MFEQNIEKVFVWFLDLTLWEFNFFFLEKIDLNMILAFDLNINYNLTGKFDSNGTIEAT